MFELAEEMLDNLVTAFENENPEMARNLLQQDEEMDMINALASKNVAQYLLQKNEDVIAALNAHSFSRKLERVGDLSKNIAEEIIFYVEAKVLKHRY